MVLSFEIGFVKPEAGFFRSLLRFVDDPSTALLVDDRERNVCEARKLGLDGWIHVDVGVTAARIGELAASSRQ
ncbi:MAG: hypothetical protein ACRDQU_04815 [Pseudonocardiaceae bacterium]